MTFRSQSVFFMALLATIFASGCLQTRTGAKDVEQRRVLQQQVSTLQRETTDSSSRFTDFNEQMREIRGRIEVLENQSSVRGGDLEKTRQSWNEQSQSTDRRVALLQESIGKMESQNQALTAEVLALKAEIAALKVVQNTESSSSSSSSGKQDSFSIAKGLFDQKEWKKAVLAFQKYRDNNPKGRNLPEATYLMGVCFQELNMKDEARAFYDEVASNFPKSNEARKAKTRLKSLK